MPGTMPWIPRLVGQLCALELSLRHAELESRFRAVCLETQLVSPLSRSSASACCLHPKHNTTKKGIAGAKAQRQVLLLIYQIMALPCWSLGVTGHFAQGLVFLKTSALLTPLECLSFPRSTEHHRKPQAMIPSFPGCLQD